MPIFRGMRIATSRIKDFYDLWTLPKAVKIDHVELANTIRGTFSRRVTAIPTSCPVGLSPEFSSEQGNGVRTPAEPRLKESRWQKSLRKYGRGLNQHVSLNHKASAFEGGLVKR